MSWRDTLNTLQESLEQRTGRAVVEHGKLRELQEQAFELGALRRDMELLGWSVLDHLSGQPQEVRAETRRVWSQRARYAWMNDPMAGAAVDLLNDFTFGRGVPKPHANSDECQAEIDIAWADPDNEAVLTSYAAQIALGTDLALQSNIFLLFFDDGDDGRVKLGMLEHDGVVDAVRDPENRLRVLYYVARQLQAEWDFKNDRITVSPQDMANATKTLYFEHWRNVRDAQDDYDAGERDKPPPRPPKDKLGQGRVYHVAINRTSEMVFGVPTMQRVLRWFSAYNDFMASRVDMTKAAASLVMKRKIKGTPNQLQRMASQAVSRAAEIGSADPHLAPRPASVVTENENVTHEIFKLTSGAGEASQDALMLRAQVSAATRFPQHYLGDAGSANLATATSMELPVQKFVESRQELFEQVFRAFTDRVIERAIDAGRLEGPAPNQPEQLEQPSPTSITQASTNGKAANGKKAKDKQKHANSYEFSMPNPLRRLMTDLVNAISMIAKTFDPNATNIELSRTLLTIALGEALEMQDPADAVERIFPDGYHDPMMTAQMASAGLGPDGKPLPADQLPPGGGGGPGLPPPGGPSGNGNGGPSDGSMPLDQILAQGGGGGPGSGQAGPYGTKSQGSLPEMLQAVYDDGEGEEIAETRYSDLPAGVREKMDQHADEAADEFRLIVGSAVDDALGRMPDANGHP